MPVHNVRRVVHALCIDLNIDDGSLWSLYCTGFSRSPPHLTSTFSNTNYAVTVPLNDIANMLINLVKIEADLRNQAAVDNTRCHACLHCNES